jgi:hypothetical protein
VAVAAAALSALGAPAYADWHLSPFFGLSCKGATTLVDFEDGATRTHWMFGGTAALLGRGWLGVEGHFLLVPGFFENDERSLMAGAAVTGLPTFSPITHSRVTTLMGNVVIAAPLDWNEFGLRPFVSGGLGLMRARQSGGPFDVNVNMLGFDVGGGAEGPLSDHTGLRFDVRFMRSLTRPEQQGITFYAASLRFWTASVGFVFRY